MLENESSSSGMDNHRWGGAFNLYKLAEKIELYVLSCGRDAKGPCKMHTLVNTNPLKGVVLFLVRLALSLIHGCCGSHGPGPGCTLGLRTSGSFSSSSCTSPSTAT